MEANDPLIGQRVKGYQVTALLSEGGMGRVYRAVHPLIGKKVALKVLHSHLTQDPNILNRFFQEAKSVNEIQHDNLIDILDFDLLPNGEPYLLMEYLDGKSLGDIVANEAPLSEERLGKIGIQACSALYAAHQKSIIHRDLKPDNIFLITLGGQKDFVKILDFGIAKLLDNGGPIKTQTGAIMGTPLCMSPEQANGGTIDARADIYSLGVILYQMACGKAPIFHENPFMLVVMQATEPPTPLRQYNPAVSQPLEETIMRCLEKERGARFASMYDLGLALAQATRLDATPFFSGQVKPHEEEDLRVTAHKAPVLQRSQPKEDDAWGLEASLETTQTPVTHEEIILDTPLGPSASAVNLSDEMTAVTRVPDLEPPVSLEDFTAQETIKGLEPVTDLADALPEEAMVTAKKLPEISRPASKPNNLSVNKPAVNTPRPAESKPAPLQSLSTQDNTLPKPRKAASQPLLQATPQEARPKSVHEQNTVIRPASNLLSTNALIALVVVLFLIVMLLGWKAFL